MSEYLVLISAVDHNRLNPSEEEKCMADYAVWAQALGEKHVFARRLNISPGRQLKSKQIPLTDGPFAEAKELIVGIFVLKADTLDEASEIADSCPLRDYFELLVKEAMI